MIKESCANQPLEELHTHKQYHPPLLLSPTTEMPVHNVRSLINVCTAQAHSCFGTGIHNVNIYNENQRVSVQSLYLLCTESIKHFVSRCVSIDKCLVLRFKNTHFSVWSPVRDEKWLQSEFHSYRKAQSSSRSMNFRVM